MASKLRKRERSHREREENLAVMTNPDTATGVVFAMTGTGTSMLLWRPLRRVGITAPQHPQRRLAFASIPLRPTRRLSKSVRFCSDKNGSQGPRPGFMRKVPHFIELLRV